MGQHGPFGRQSSDRRPGVAPIIDAVALEERLKVARELRAEAIARRQGSARGLAPQPSPPPPLPAQSTDPAAPPAAARRVAARPSQRRAASPHPLVALLALGISASFLLSRGAPEAASPPEVPALTAAVETPAAPLAQPAPAPIAAPPALRRAELPAAKSQAAESQAAEFQPASGSTPGAATSALPAAAVDVVAAIVRAGPPAPAARAAPEPRPEAVVADPNGQAAPAPRPERILINAPRSVAPDAVDAALDTLRATGFAEVVSQPTRLSISTTSVRYYNAEDAAAATEIAAMVAPLLPGGVAEARDFTDAPSRAAPGRLEIWVAGAGLAAGGAGPVRPQAAVIDPAAIRRLVDSVRAEPSIENAGRGVAEAARGFETGAERVARQIDAALGGAVDDAVRALDLRP